MTKDNKASTIVELAKTKHSNLLLRVNNLISAALFSPLFNEEEDAAGAVRIIVKCDVLRVHTASFLDLLEVEIASGQISGLDVYDRARLAYHDAMELTAPSLPRDLYTCAVAWAHYPSMVSDAVKSLLWIETMELARASNAYIPDWMRGLALKPR